MEEFHQSTGMTFAMLAHIQRGKMKAKHLHLTNQRGQSPLSNTCLAVFQENQETNSVVKKAAMVVQGLMKKLNVVIDNVSSDALELDMPGRAREQELQASETTNGGLPHRDLSKGIEDPKLSTSVRAHDALDTHSEGAVLCPLQDVE